jgi:hypothetical protein
VKEFLGHRCISSIQVYIHIERALYQHDGADDFHVKVAATHTEITPLLASGFEFVL